MNIKIKFSRQEAHRRAAKLVGVDDKDIISVTPTEGGKRFYICWLARRKKGGTWTRTNIVTVWEMLDALPLDDLSGSLQNIWERGLDSLLQILDLDKMPQSQEEVKAAYRKVVKIHHPDVGGDPAIFRQCVAAFQQISQLVGDRKKAKKEWIEDLF